MVSDSQSTVLTVSRNDGKSLLNSLYYTIESIDYPNTGTFSECLKLLIHSYLRGRGLRLDGISQNKKKEEYTIYLANILWDMATENESYDWFVWWIDKVEKAMKRERYLTMTVYCNIFECTFNE